ncbi:hypothetical protein [Pedobacter psychrodurus]|uniref:hypothetical protein n=1 Tax=Pedobacter psychrodurus TaxID=2530456 RepID=UPI002931B3D5|nr:hypothetical protein [Pedobacter psychrodurus]
MHHKFDKKFTEKDLDFFIDKIYKDVLNKNSDSYIFDLTELQWISNQELLVFTALIKYLSEKAINLEIHFFKKGIPITEIDKRIVEQLVEIWDVWHIWDVVPQEKLYKIFGFDGGTIDRLKNIHKINNPTDKIYNRYGITPFISLEKIKNYGDRDIEDVLKSLYKLTSATSEIIYQHNCEHPFVNDTLSAIVSKELYENFLDHFTTSFLNARDNWAFMSLSLKAKVNPKRNSHQKIQNILESNFRDESIPEFKNFFFDETKNEFKNLSYIQYSFLDFGDGIVETLKSEFELRENQQFTTEKSSAVLKYAFKHDSSRQPITTKTNKINSLIPRGLFDILSIVHRYEGLLVARSNYGKIFYDFTNGQSFETAFSHFGKSNLFFPGTLISIYLPAIPLSKKPDISVIKPEIIFDSYTAKKKSYLHIYHIINRIRSSKKDLYKTLLSVLMKKMANDGVSRTIYFSFKGYETDKRIARKVIFYLLTDYDINLNNNVIVINPPSREIFEEINNEVLTLSGVIKKYIIHPLPFIYYQPDEDNLELQWLGVYEESDRLKLNDLLFEDFSLAHVDFSEPDNVVGHLNYFDKFGNLKSIFPNRNELISYFSNEYEISEQDAVKELLEDNLCLEKSTKDSIYLCNGNYYQFEFIDLINLLNKENDCNLISEILFRRMAQEFIDLEGFYYIGITSSSHKILQSLINQKLINEQRVLFFDNYHAFAYDENFETIADGQEFILVCDAIATGFLTNKVRKELVKKRAVLKGVAVIVDTIDKDFENTGDILSDKSMKIISLYTKRIQKYRRSHKEIQPYLHSKKVTRINPFTNLPVTLSIRDTSSDRVLMSNEQFLRYITDDQIKIGYYKFNNVIHPYFFDTKSIIESAKPELFKKLFDKIEINSKDLKVFYPKKSGMNSLNLEMFKNQVLMDHSIEVFELERFNTPEGWRFPHTTDHFSTLTENKTVLILDDGSCSGDSLIQMVDELTLFNIKEIVLLCLIGRVNDQKREFFSRMTHVRLKSDRRVKISIYFGSHWHIPTYYIDDNPTSLELKWLEEMIDLQNTPESIRTIAKTISKAITAQDKSSFKNYKYLPKIRKNPGRIAKKEIIKAREEIGKVIGYRFYKESFSFFDEIIRKYESSSKEERNKEIELLCCVFLYEPYLYTKVKQIMPDIVDKIEEFIDALIFGNPKRDGKKINIQKDLTYEWDKKDILHLFFIVFKGEQLIEKLNVTEKFSQIIAFISDVDFGINYILYKLLAYFPVTKNSPVYESTGDILHLLDISLQEKLFPEQFEKEVKIFRSFLSTLPAATGYSSSLAVINENYRKLTDAIMHKFSITVQYDIMMVDIEVLSNSFDKSVKDDFVETWLKLSNFIAPILSFAKTFPGFYMDRLDQIEGETGHSLRKIHGQLNELINYANQDSDFKTINFLLERFKRKFLETESEMFQTFNRISTSDIMKVINELFISRDLIDEVEFVYNNVKETNVDVPPFILINIVLNEIIINLRHRDKSSKINITYTETPEYLFLNFSNRINNDIKHGGGNGLVLLYSVKEFPGERIKYKNNQKTKSLHFVQEIRLKKI